MGTCAGTVKMTITVINMAPLLILNSLHTPDFTKTLYVEGDPGSGSDPSLLYSVHQIAGLTL